MVFVFYVSSLILGLVGLVSGADILVRKSYHFAHCLKVKQFVVGVLLLGMGTSLPEWATSVVSALQDLPDVAIGNVLGSNIFNILVVLSFILLSASSPDHFLSVKKDLWFLIVTSLSLIPLLWDGSLSRWDGLLLMIIFVIYIAMTLFLKSSSQEDDDDDDSSSSFTSASLLWASASIVMGFILLIVGSYVTIYAAKYLGHGIGLSDRVIGILIVSVGTSLPELLVCVSAMLKGYKNMAMGNILGSNVFNTFAILSTSSLIRPSTVDSKIMTVDLPVLFIAYAGLLLLLLSVFKKRTWKNCIAYYYLILYVAYVVYILIAS